MRLYRYRSEQRRWTTPLLFVHSLVSKTYVFDLAPGNSFVETMLQRGHDVYLLDWGTPNELEAGNTLETYSDDYIPAAVRAGAANVGGRRRQRVRLLLRGHPLVALCRRPHR